MERLEFYDRIGLVSVSLKRKVLYWLLFLFGFIIGLSGIFTLIYSATLYLLGVGIFGLLHVPIRKSNERANYKTNKAETRFRT